MNKEELNPEVQESIKDMPNRTTKFICKVCGRGFEDGNMLDSHIAEYHHPKRTVTVNDIINSVFKGTMNFPKTKAEIVKYVEEHKDDPSVTPDVIDLVRNLADKRYNSEAELSAEINKSNTVISGVAHRLLKPALLYYFMVVDYQTKINYYFYFIIAVTLTLLE